ncbi:MAG: hypothetical protein P8Y71_12690 [Pseudolabrys sp.]
MTDGKAEPKNRSGASMRHLLSTMMRMEIIAKRPIVHMGVTTTRTSTPVISLKRGPSRPIVRFQLISFGKRFAEIFLLRFFAARASFGTRMRLNGSRRCRQSVAELRSRHSMTGGIDAN